MAINKQALFVYSFGLKESPGAVDRTYLSDLWVRYGSQASAGGLQLSAPAEAMSSQHDLPASLDQARLSFSILASGKRPPSAGGGADAAFFFEYLDVAGVCCCLAPNDTTPQWKKLVDKWHGATDAWLGQKPSLGETLVFYGLYQPGMSLESLTPIVSKSLPEQFCLDLRTPAYFTPQGLFVWDTGEQDGQRLLVVVVPETKDDDRAATAWLFWQDNATLAPLPRFLLHAGKLRQQQRTYYRDISEVRSRQARVEGILAEAIRLDDSIETGGSVHNLITAQSRLSRAQISTAGLVMSESLLRELGHSVRLAGRNMRALTPRERNGVATKSSFYRRPIQESQQLHQQISADLLYIVSTNQRSQELLRLITLRIEEAKEASSRRQHKMDLTQTVLIGALLVCLDAMHAFHTELPLADQFQWPVITLLMSITFLLPPLFVHWREGYGYLEDFGGLILGTSAAWVTLTILEPRMEELVHRKLWTMAIVLAHQGIGYGLIRAVRMFQSRKGNVWDMPTKKHP